MTATVLQCDREAAADMLLWRGLPRAHAAAARSGKLDDQYSVQAFARHRHDSTREMGFDDWCKRQIAKLSAIMNPYVMQGLDLDAPDYRHLLGQHHAFMRMRSFIHGSRKQGTDR